MVVHFEPIIQNTTASVFPILFIHMTLKVDADAIKYDFYSGSLCFVHFIVEKYFRFKIMEILNGMISDDDGDTMSQLHEQSIFIWNGSHHIRT